MASRREMEDFELWSAVGKMEGQSITGVDFFFDVHHSVLSRSWKKILNSQTVVGKSVTCRQGLRPSQMIDVLLL